MAVVGHKAQQSLQQGKEQQQDKVVRNGAASVRYAFLSSGKEG